MSTSSQNPSPDFGEPWKCETGDFEIYSKSEHNATAYAESARIRNRIIKCVNDCQGMADPAAEIEAMRVAIREAYTALERCKADRGERDKVLIVTTFALAKLQPFLP